MTAKATTQVQAKNIANVVKGSLATQRKAFRKNAKAKKAAKSGTKIRHGIRQQSALELNAIVQGARGDVTKVTAADVRAKVSAMRTARADVAEAMAASDIDRVMKLSGKYNLARSAAKVALNDHKEKRESLAATKLDVAIASKVAAVVRSFVASYSDDNAAAIRLGTFSEEDQNTIRAAFATVLETVAPMCNRAGDRNGYKA
jgi:hypothetical protein